MTGALTSGRYTVGSAPGRNPPPGDGDALLGHVDPVRGAWDGPHRAATGHDDAAGDVIHVRALMTKVRRRGGRGQARSRTVASEVPWEPDQALAGHRIGTIAGLAAGGGGAGERAGDVPVARKEVEAAMHEAQRSQLSRQVYGVQEDLRRLSDMLVDFHAALEAKAVVVAGASPALQEAVAGVVKQLGDLGHELSAPPEA